MTLSQARTTGLFCLRHSAGHQRYEKVLPVSRAPRSDELKGYRMGFALVGQIRPSAAARSSKIRATRCMVFSTAFLKKNWPTWMPHPAWTRDCGGHQNHVDQRQGQKVRRTPSPSLIRRPLPAAGNLHDPPSWPAPKHGPCPRLTSSNLSRSFATPKDIAAFTVCPQWRLWRNQKKT